MRKDGSEGVTETVAVTCRNSAGEAIAIIGVNRDITERKKSEELLQQKMKFEQLLFSVSQAIRQSLNIQVILETATQEVKKILKVDRAAIYRFNPDWSGEFIVESVENPWTKLVGTDNPLIWTDTYLQEHRGGRFALQQSFIAADIYQANLQPLVD